MTAAQKAYRGVGMEGFIATWYTKNTGRDLRRFKEMARTVATRAPAACRMLEVAPGPGYLSIELAQRGYRVTALDISKSFVRIAQKNAAATGVAVEVHLGNASAMPLPDASFDFVVCSAAFKNFSDPIGALNEMHRVLAPGGQASIFDLRKDASRADIEAEVRSMRMSPINAWVTRLTFRFMLLKSAYTREEIQRMITASRFHGGEIASSGIGFELRLSKAR
jgi:ubiquinone/menaquinone biosynthesis C-methylase UbiE